jgi:hypothetical protein
MFYEKGSGVDSRSSELLAFSLDNKTDPLVEIKFFFIS